MPNPLCRYFGECGGCTAQHIDYQIQLENKKKALADAVHFKDIKVFSGKEYYYRNRMDMLFNPIGVGFRKKGQWRNVIDIEKCAISNERLNILIKEIRDFFKKPDYFDLVKHSGTLRYAVIRTPDNDSSISFVLNDKSNRLSEAIEKIKEFAGKTTANNIIVTEVPPETDLSVSDEFFAVKGTDKLKEKYLGKEFLFPAQGFFQVNSEMAEKMQEYCHNLLKAYETKDAYLLDLYSGVGTFGIINAELFKEVTLLESCRQSIEAAKKNIRQKNIKAVELDARYLKRIEFPKDLFVITDPPRTGMHPKTIEQLNRLNPKVIIYISCNVSQLGKDVKKFKDYKIKSAALFDLFPQTPHSEAVVELIKE